MDWAGPAGAAWLALQGLQREPWFAAAAATVILGLLLLLFVLALRLRRLNRRLAASADPARTLYQAVVTTREARSKAAAVASVRSADGQPKAAASSTSKGFQPALRVRTPAVSMATAAPCLVKIYVDGSNLQENWEAIQHRSNEIDETGVDWDALPRLLIDDIARRPDFAGRRIVYCGTHVYGSYFPAQYYDLLERLETGAIKSTPVPYMEFRRGRARAAVEQTVPAAHPGREAEVQRRVKARMLAELDEWRLKNQAQVDLLTRGLPNRFGYRSFPFERRVRRDLKKARYNSNGLPQADEKGLDVHCCTDLMADGVFDIFDVAVIVSNDSDFVPAIAFVKEELGKTVIQLGPRTMSDAVRAACSGHIDLEDMVKQVNVSRQTARPAPPASPKTAPVPIATIAPLGHVASPADPPQPVAAAPVPVKSA
jgi:NYN domain